MRPFLMILLLTWASCSAVPGESPPVADPAATTPLVFVDEAGSRHDVEAILAGGSPVALVFWQTWCVSCRAEGPALVHAAKTYAGKIAFFGVVSGDEDAVSTDELTRVTQQLALPYPQVRDRTGAVAERFHVQGTPTILVLGTDGAELYRGRDLPEDWQAFVRS